jgi:hypothetical protein
MMKENNMHPKDETSHPRFQAGIAYRDEFGHWRVYDARERMVDIIDRLLNSAKRYEALYLLHDGGMVVFAESYRGLVLKYCIKLSDAIVDNNDSEEVSDLSYNLKVLGAIKRKTDWTLLSNGALYFQPREN